MDAGYEPGRVRLLSQRTQESIEALDALASADPAAADAVRTIRLARRNLEDHWMSALHELERSDTMLRWRSSSLNVFGLRTVHALGDTLPDHLRPGGYGVVSLSSTGRSRLLGRLELLERRASGDAANRRAGLDPSGDPTGAEVAALARRLAFWVQHDDELADELVELSVSNLMVGRLLGEAEFPSSFASDIARRMAAPNGPDTHVDHDRYALALSTVLASMTDDPAACLDLLLDQPTAYALAAWPALDTAMLAEFTVSGLHTAIDEQPDRLREGYEVLAFLTRAANGPLDGGMNAGVAVGVAASLAGYVDTLAPAVEQEGATPVVIRAVDPPIELGTYDDLVDLFGAVLRAPEAQPALGTVLAGYTLETFERVGAEATTRPDVTHLADFADLLGDATRAEQAELVMAAAVDEARRRQLSGLIGFGTNVTLLAGGAGSVARSIAGRAIEVVAELGSRTEPEQLPAGRIPAHTYDLITMAAVAVAVADPTIRRDAGLGDVTETQWSEARRRIEHIERLNDPHERSLAIGDLDHWIAASVPALSAYLLELRKLPGMSELKEGRNAVRAD